LKIISAISLGLVLTTSLPCSAEPKAQVAVQESAGTVSVLVPAGTAVPVHVVGTLSSGSAKSGDTFPIQIADDVVVNGMIVFRKGAGGQGMIVDSDGAGGNGHSGAIALAFKYVYSADGGIVELSRDPQKQAEEDRKGASSTATIIGFATFGLGGLFGHNLARGRQKTIDETTIMSAFVSDNVHVESSEHAVPERYDK
jgi:hypothetical protein